MANIPPMLPNGRLDPTASGLTPEATVRLKKLEELEEVLREDLKAKHEKTRKDLQMWGKLERESASWGLKSELSERHLRSLTGEGVGGQAF